MRHISQRELRNDNAEVMRMVEDGESFVVTRNGQPVAQLTPLPVADDLPGLPLARKGTRRVRYADWPRIQSSVSAAQVLEDLRDDR